MAKNKYYLTYIKQMVIVSDYSHLRKKRERKRKTKWTPRKRRKTQARKTKKKGGKGKEEVDKLRGPETDMMEQRLGVVR